MSAADSLADRYSSALHMWMSAGNEVSVTVRAAALDRVEQEILTAADYAPEGADPIVLMALAVPNRRIGGAGIARRREQLQDYAAAHQLPETYAWDVIERTKHVYQHRIEIAEARQSLRVSLDKIATETAHATSLLDALEELGDSAVITPRRGGRGVLFVEIEQALYAVRVGTTAAQHLAPKPDAVED